MMNYESGKFHKLKAIADFNFGPLNGVTIREGTVVEFDGTTLKLEGKDHVCREFNLAVKAKFVVPTTDTTTTYEPASSKVKVKTATSQGENRDAVDMGAAVREEEVVSRVEDTNDKREAASTAQVEKAVAPQPTPVEKPAQPLSVEEADRRNAEAIRAVLDQPVKKGMVGGTRHDRAEADADARDIGGKFKLQSMDGGNQGVVVGKVKASDKSATTGRTGEATKTAATDVTRTTADAVESGLKPQKVVEGIRGIEAKTASTQKGIQNLQAQVASMEDGIRENPPKPMTPTTLVTEGEDIRVTENGVTGDVSEAASGEELTELLPDAAVASPPKTAAKPQRSNPEDEIQEILDTWDKKRHWRKRVSEAVDFYGDWPEALEAIYSIEAPSVIKHIKSQLLRK